jgi:hypothetical protein
VKQNNNKREAKQKTQTCHERLKRNWVQWLILGNNVKENACQKGKILKNESVCYLRPNV